MSRVSAFFINVIALLLVSSALVALAIVLTQGLDALRPAGMEPGLFGLFNGFVVVGTYVSVLGIVPSAIHATYMNRVYRDREMGSPQALMHATVSGVVVSCLVGLILGGRSNFVGHGYIAGLGVCALGGATVGLLSAVILRAFLVKKSPTA